MGANLKLKFDSSKKHPLPPPTYRGLNPPHPPPSPSSSYVNARVRWLWMAVKIPFSLALSELVLDDAKFEILLISWHFLVVLWMQSLPAHLLILLCFGILKVFRWHIYGPSFIYVWLVVLEFLNLKCFHTSREYNFRLLLGAFLDVTDWNVVKFVWNFEQWCNAL